MNFFRKKFWVFLGLGIPLFSDSGPKEIPLSVFLEEAKANRKLGLLFRTKKQALDALGRDKFREFFPKVSLGYFGIKNLGENQADSRYQDVRLNVQQLVWDGGQAYRQWEIAKLAEQIYSLDSQRERDILDSDLKKMMYRYQLFLAKEKVLQRRNSEEYQNFQNTIKQWQNGEISQLEMMKKKVIHGEVDFQTKQNSLERERIYQQLKDFSLWDSSQEITIQEFFPRDVKLLRLPEISEISIEERILQNIEIRKTRLTLEKIQKEKENSEQDWVPKVSVGAYYGRNTFDTTESSKEIAGWNFQVAMPFSGSNVSTQSFQGFQPEGGGFQRLPGFGTSSVGPGQNTFQSGNLGILDTLGPEAVQKEAEARALDAKIQVLQRQRAMVSEAKSLYQKLCVLYDNILLREIRLTNTYEDFQFARAKKKKGMSREEMQGHFRSLEELYFQLLEDTYQYLEMSDRFQLLTGEPKWELYQFTQNRGFLQYWNQILVAQRDLR